MSTSNLVGKSVSFFLDGGWEISGKVVGQESDKIILDKDGELYLLFKAKVNFIRLDLMKKTLDSSSEKTSESHDTTENMFPENGISYSETFMNIPGSLLGRKNSEEDDFSVSFKESVTNNVLSFKVEDDF